MNTSTIQSVSPTVLFLSHGGGPLPLLGDAGHSEMVASLQTIAQQLAKPTAIVVISAHWEAAVPSIVAAAKPDLIYDYYGFPEPAYDIQYPAAGNPHLAEQIASCLYKRGMTAELDVNRGFDHGMYVPLKIMYPDADIPCVQLSLLKNLDPAQHIKYGTALADLNQENLLVIGSGFSFHNMQAFFAPSTSQSQAMNNAFEAWLHETCHSHELSEADRAQRLINWTTAPHARYCHPREEHLLPLHVCYGVAQRACSEIFEMTILGKQASAILWCR